MSFFKTEEKLGFGAAVVLCDNNTVVWEVRSVKEIISVILAKRKYYGKEQTAMLAEEALWSKLNATTSLTEINEIFEFAQSNDEYSNMANHALEKLRKLAAKD